MVLSLQRHRQPVLILAPVQWLGSRTQLTLPTFPSSQAWCQFISLRNCTPILLLNPKGLRRWGGRKLLLALSHFLLLCSKARMGQAPAVPPAPSLHSSYSGLRERFCHFPVFKPVHFHPAHCHLSLQSLSCSAGFKMQVLPG